MKNLRIWLLLLLAVLLPARGAMTAAMLCPPAGTGTQHEVSVFAPHAGHHALMDAAAKEAVQDHVAPGHEAAGTDVDGTLSAQDKCDLCSAFCSVTPFASSAFTMPVPQHLPVTAFPALATPAPSFFSDGQERPPRSI